jgi:hypothetical protein
MQKRAMFWLAAGAALVVAATRWPFRSHALYSWDSANFALAMADIDIAAHRPHPPGYIGYVLAARALDVVFRDPNLSLVVWNIAATALAAAVLVRFAWELADEQRQTRTAVAAALIFTTSPLIWYHGEIAEIPASELLATSQTGVRDLQTHVSPVRSLPVVRLAQRKALLHRPRRDTTSQDRSPRHAASSRAAA